MVKYFVFILTGLFVSVLAVQDVKIDSYNDLQNAIEKLADSKQYLEAISLIENEKDKFPGREFDLLAELSSLYLKTEQFEKCYKVWADGHRKGYFFLLDPRFDQFKSIAVNEQFKLYAAADKALREKALGKSKTIYELFLPEGYDKNRKYPLFIILHGGGRNIESAKKDWEIVPPLNSDYIVVYLQSYLHYDYASFGWRSSDKRAFKDIKTIFDKIKAEYKVDTTKIIVGGVSAGGVAAIDLAIHEIIPVKGVIGFCPGKPKAFDADRAEILKKNGVRFFIVSGEKDFYLERQKQMTAVFDKTKIPYQFKIIPAYQLIKNIKIKIFSHFKSASPISERLFFNSFLYFFMSSIDDAA